MNKTRILSFLLALVMVLAMLPVGAFATESADLAVNITHISLDPSKDALGFKAKVEGSQTMLEAVTEIGFCFRVNGGTEKVFKMTKTPKDGVFTARVTKILAKNGGESILEAYAFVRVGDVTVNSQWQSTSMKKTLQAVDAAWYSAGYTQAQKKAVKELCEKFEEQVEPWALNNIFGAFFGSADGYETDPQMDLSTKGSVTVANNGISFGYINDFKEDNFYFECKFHVNDVLETENWPKFGLFVQGEKIREAFYVDMTRELTASVVGRVTSINGIFDWENTKTARVDAMAFSSVGENVTLGILKDGKRLHLFVNGAYAMSSVCGFDGNALAGIFSFNTGMTVTQYFTDLTAETLAAKKTLVPAGEQDKGELFGCAVGDGVSYNTSNEVDLSKDQGDAPSVSIYGGAPQYTYLNDAFTDKFCFETEINVEGVLNNDGWPKFGIMVNGASEMVKFFVDMTPAMTATHVGVVYQPTGGGDDWANSRSCEVPGMSFTGNDTVKLKLIRDGRAYYFYVNDALVLWNEQGFQEERGAVGIFSFNTALTAKGYSMEVGPNAEGIQAIYQVGLTNHWFADNGSGVYTLTTDSDAQHKVDDLTRGGIVMRKASYRVGGKLTLNDAYDWGQARILISADSRNEYFIALEKLPAGNYQIFIMSKAEQDNWDNWVLIGETGKNSLNFEVVVNENKVYFLLDGMICYETDRVAMTESTVKFTGFNIGTTTVQDLALEIFGNADAAAAYISTKAYKPEGVQETYLSTNHFTQGAEGEYTLSTNSDAQHLVDDVLVNGLIMRENMYSLKGRLSLTDAGNWGQARILISADANNEYFIALEKTDTGLYQIFTMSKASQGNWDNWVKIGNSGKNVQDFELVVNGNKVYFLLGDLICYETDRVAMTESTVKFTGFNVGTTTVQDLQLKTFTSSDAVTAYVAGKEHKTPNNPETLLSTNYFAETKEGVYTLVTDSDAQHKVDDVLADGSVMRNSFYTVKGRLSLTEASDWGQSRILISADAQNEYFIALEKLPSGNYQMFSMSKAGQENWDVWQSIADENTNGSRNSIDFELIVIGSQVNLLIDDKLVYKTSRVQMAESTVKFTGYNTGTTTVEGLKAQIFNTQADAESYLMDRTLAPDNAATYKNGLKTLGADPGVIYVTEGKDAGCYYMYVTSDSLGCTGFLAYKSKDLVNWECVSTALSRVEAYYDESAGHMIASYLTTDYWAPEVIYDGQTKLYYMFYNADRYDNEGCFFGDIAVSADPAGPFIPYNQYLGKAPVLIDEENDIWAYEPVFNFEKMDPSHELYESSSDGYMKVIDLNPFVDPVTGQKYVYFCHDVISTATKSSIYAMELEDDFTPNYSSVASLLTAESALGEGKVNEASFVVYNEQSGKYYLLYSANRYYQTSYCVRVAVADSPLGPFTKLSEAEGGYLLYGNDQMSGTGHCSVVNRDGQDYIVYHAHKEKTEDTFVRGIAMDQLYWAENANGLLVPVVNGPSNADMPLTTADYVNIASNATITASNLVSNSAGMLTDGIILHRESSFLQNATFDGSGATIKLQFEKAQPVSAVGIYNGYEKPFADVVSVRLYFANGESICYTADSLISSESVVLLKTISVDVVAVEIIMPAADAEYTISEIAVMSQR